MARPISDIAFTRTVKAAQEKLGSRSAYAKMEQRGSWQNVITPQLREFVAERDFLYLGTANAEGQPYIQHRGGPKGFLKVLDQHTFAMADYTGNAQYISLGNLSENDKAFIFLMDYPNRHRIKIWGTAEFVEDDAELLGRVVDPDYQARPQRVLVFHVKAWDVNCTQHIRRRFTAEEMEPIVQKLLHDSITELGTNNAALELQLTEAGIEPKVNNTRSASKTTASSKPTIESDECRTPAA